MVGASPATRLMAAVRSCTDWYGCLRSILAAKLLLAGFTQCVVRRIRPALLHYAAAGGASPATRLMAAVRSCTDWYGCLRSILAAMLLLAGFTLGVAYMTWSSYRLIVPCMHGRVRFRPSSSVFHATKKAVQIFAPLTKHFRLNQSLLVQVKSSIFSKVSADNSLVPTLPPK